MRFPPYITVSGAALDSNKVDGSFRINASQYTTYYRSNRTKSCLPVQGNFLLSKYSDKKPVPTNNSFVTIDGFLTDVVTDHFGEASLFEVSVDNISFLGKIGVSPTTSGSHAGQGTMFCCVIISPRSHTFLSDSKPNRSSRFKFDFASSSKSSIPDGFTTADDPSSSQLGKRPKK